MLEIIPWHRAHDYSNKWLSFTVTHYQRCSWSVFPRCSSLIVQMWSEKGGFHKPVQGEHTAEWWWVAMWRGWHEWLQSHRRGIYINFLTAFLHTAGCALCRRGRARIGTRTGDTCSYPRKARNGQTNRYTSAQTPINLLPFTAVSRLSSLAFPRSILAFTYKHTATQVR